MELRAVVLPLMAVGNLGTGVKALAPPGKPFKSSTECKFMKKKINTHAKGHCMSKNMEAKVRMRKRSEKHQDSPAGEF